MPTSSEQLTVHDVRVRRAQLSHLVQSATHSLAELQRDGEWGTHAAARLAEAAYALHRALIALTEIDTQGA